ncbi:MAG: hypothetical protein H7Y38_12390 [Armatimonadetes bacterium]|nr:hypothetical protein [Armatimonadota bacterium]
MSIVMASSAAENNEEVVSPFSYTTTQRADFCLADALRFLCGSPGGEESAARFNDRFDEELDALCQTVAEEIAETGRYHKRIDVPASAYHSRPTYRLDVQTVKKRARRSGSGLWYVYYTIDDADKDGKPDTITVISIYGSRSQPLAINTGQFDLPDDNEEETGQ